MSSPFAITTAANTVTLDSNHQGQTSFTVSNTMAHATRGHARIVAQPASAGAWVTLQGEAERTFSSSGSQQYTVQIAVPANAPAGDYTLRLDMVDTANPDDDFSEGPTVGFQVAAPAPVKKPFPWWIVAVAVGIVIVVGGGAYGLVQAFHKAPVVKPTITPAPTPPSRSVWQGTLMDSNGSQLSVTLNLNTFQNGQVTGTMSVLSPVSLYRVSGTKGSLSQFNATDQARFQQLVQLYGSGTGVFLKFSDPTNIQQPGDGQGSIPLNSSFYAFFVTKGRIQGHGYSDDSTHYSIFTLRPSPLPNG